MAEAADVGGVPWRSNLPKPYDLPRYTNDRFPEIVWMVQADDVWTVHCMDCGFRLGTVNAGNERGALRLHEDHEYGSHR